MKKILISFGTRPEAIKMCPLVRELTSRKNFETIVCVTGQHREILQQVLDIFSVTPDYNLDIMRPGQDLFQITTSILENIKKVLVREKPDIVLVHGDTSTTFAAALAAFYLQIPVGHVEAGLRTYNIHSPFPEEYNRRAVGIMSELHFSPTLTAKNHLIQEGTPEGHIYVTGNTAIDALQSTIQEDYSHEHLDWAKDSRLLLLTAHRRENWGEPLAQILNGIRRAVDEAPDVKVIYPAHPNPQIRTLAREIFQNHDRIRIIDPLDSIDFHNFMKRSYLIATDSGGIQEEAPALGKPTLVLRDTTERPEGIQANVLKLTGTREESVYEALQELLKDPKIYQRMSSAKNPYGDGQASRRIADILEGKATDEFRYTD